MGCLGFRVSGGQKCAPMQHGPVHGFTNEGLLVLGGGNRDRGLNLFAV
jgi:hypothetical protein